MTICGINGSGYNKYIHQTTTLKHHIYAHMYMQAVFTHDLCILHALRHLSFCEIYKHEPAHQRTISTFLCAHACMYECMYLCVRVRACACVRARVCARVIVRACVRACVKAPMSS